MMHLKGKIRKHKIRLASLISPFFFFFLMDRIWVAVCSGGTKTPNESSGNILASLWSQSLRKSELRVSCAVRNIRHLKQ